MHWYGKSDALSWKVKSAFFDVELHDGQLWGVADCQLLEPLEGDELNRLTTYLAGQAPMVGARALSSGKSMLGMASCMSISGRITILN